MITHYHEIDLLPLSKLADLIFCPRRAALHLLENIWQENVFTAEGQNLHQKTHAEEVENRPGFRIVRGLRIHSFRLGLAGQADVVEFHQAADEDNGVSGARLIGQSGRWQPYPVEYKRGVTKDKLEYKIQLCAQALCLEEMLNVAVPEGAIYYGKSKRRYVVEFDENLRLKVEKAARELHNLFNSRQTPKAVYEKKCDKCSLYEICRPKTTGPKKKVDEYIRKHCILD